jgi:pimeloyl-ACP methyl ester carboxylesterase
MFGGRELQLSAQSDAAGAPVIPDLPRRITAELSTRGYLPAILSSERHTLSQGLEAAHREVGAMYIPTLAIWGGEDAVIPTEAIGQLAQWNRQAHQEVIPGAGHGLLYSHPKEVLGAIRAFLREVPE